MNSLLSQLTADLNNCRSGQFEFAASAARSFVLIATLSRSHPSPVLLFVINSIRQREQGILNGVLNHLAHIFYRCKQASCRLFEYGCDPITNTDIGSGGDGSSFHHQRLFGERLAQSICCFRDYTGSRLLRCHVVVGGFRRCCRGISSRVGRVTMSIRSAAITAAGGCCGGEATRGGIVLLVNAHPSGPAGLGLLVAHVYLERERVRVVGRDGRDVVHVRVGDGDRLHDGGAERALHGLADLGTLRLGLGLGHRHLDGPALPGHVLLPSSKPRLTPLLFEELDPNLAPAAASPGAGLVVIVGVAAQAVGALRVKLTDEAVDARVDQGLHLGLVDVGHVYAGDLAGSRDDDGEVSKEEDVVDYSYTLKLRCG